MSEIINPAGFSAANLSLAAMPLRWCPSPGAGAMLEGVGAFCSDQIEYRVPSAVQYVVAAQMHDGQWEAKTFTTSGWRTFATCSLLRDAVAACEEEWEWLSSRVAADWLRRVSSRIREESVRHLRAQRMRHEIEQYDAPAQDPTYYALPKLEVLGA